MVAAAAAIAWANSGAPMVMTRMLESFWGMSKGIGLFGLAVWVVVAVRLVGIDEAYVVEVFVAFGVWAIGSAGVSTQTVVMVTTEAERIVLLVVMDAFVAAIAY